MNSGLNDYESLVNTTGNEYLEQDLEALEVQIIALQVEETRNYKLNGSKQMDNGYTPTNDYDLITLKFFNEHNIITMSFLRTDGGNAMLADITMESLNEIDINGCRAISNQNTESKQNFQTFDYRTILQNGYYSGNTVNDWVGNNSIIISHKDGKVTINEATIDFSNNQIVNFSQLNNITAAEVATLAGSDTNTTLQTQINDGMTEIGNLTAEVLNLDTKVTNLDNTVIRKGLNMFPDTFEIEAGGKVRVYSQDFCKFSAYTNVDLTAHNGNIVGYAAQETILNSNDFKITNDSFFPYQGSLLLSHGHNITIKSYALYGNLEYGAIDMETKLFNKLVRGDRTITVNGDDTKTVLGLMELKANNMIENHTGNKSVTTVGPIDFKSTTGHFHVDATNVNLVSNDQVEIQAATEILGTAQNNIVLAATTGKVALTSGTNVELNSTVDVALDGQNINSNAAVTNTITGNSGVNITSLFGPIVIDASTLGINIECKNNDMKTEAKNTVINSTYDTTLEAQEILLKPNINRLNLWFGNVARDISKYLRFYEARSQNPVESLTSTHVNIVNGVWNGFDFYDAKNNWSYPWIIQYDLVDGVQVLFGSQNTPDNKYGFYNLPLGQYALSTQINAKWLTGSHTSNVFFRWVLYDINNATAIDTSNTFVLGFTPAPGNVWIYGTTSYEWNFDTHALNLTNYNVVLQVQGGNAANPNTSFNIVPDIRVSLRGVSF